MNLEEMDNKLKRQNTAKVDGKRSMLADAYIQANSKSKNTSMWLTIFLGPLGLFYSKSSIAIMMTLATTMITLFMFLLIISANDATLLMTSVPVEDYQQLRDVLSGIFWVGTFVMITLSTVVGQIMINKHNDKVKAFADVMTE